MAYTAHMSAPRPISLLEIYEAAANEKRVPSIDLQWEPFQSTVESFLRSMDAYAQEAKKNITLAAEDHAIGVRSANAESEEMERKIQLEKEREREMLSTLQAERHTLSDIQSSLTHIRQVLAKTKDQSVALEAELSTVRKEVTAQRSEKERQESSLKAMRSKDAIELDELEKVIGWSVVGVRQDELLNRFTLIDPSEPDREFSFVIDISKEDYSVTKCSPPLPAIPELVRQLNTDRDFFGFIKQVRKAFRALVIPAQDTPSPYVHLAGPGVIQPNGKNKGSEGVIDGSAIGGLKL